MMSLLCRLGRHSWAWNLSDGLRFVPRDGNLYANPSSYCRRCGKVKDASGRWAIASSNEQKL